MILEGVMKHYIMMSLNSTGRSLVTLLRLMIVSAI